MPVEVDELIAECVRLSNEGFACYDRVYRRCLRDMEAVSFPDITQEDMLSVVRPFLYRWGRMGRVLGRMYKGWQPAVCERIRTHAETLEALRDQRLEDAAFDIRDHEEQIQAVYEVLRKAAGPVGGAKILHLTCPALLPPWDNAIAKAVRDYLNRTIPGTRSLGEFSAVDYGRFISFVRTFMRLHDPVLAELAARFDKTKVKIVDDCFWWTAHNSLRLFF